ncbi:hypothetical protein DACRYDRAFT_81581 [Dacryopinax primogenitus]|uniref:RAVE complex protein Rav1 C-terminal domain-containing protein n=1 Tax=Dacryopinax primogenitus (strain DJM 731) TaxID=1858805 RepID=M5G253_DACPD|nr:uncharacterized protein DACRYDRAFT_81581 [Dacryopinax primogenitus]EJT99961.1 hypothetical protein DACRYDRAFT_81581 [Dacryopinax primogenitus]
MLEISRVFPGAPNAEAELCFLLHRGQLLVVYSSQGNIVLLKAPTLAVHRVIAFFEAYPGFTELEARIGALVTDSDVGLIVAAVGTQIAFWVPGVGDKWKVHSTLSVPLPVRSLDHQAGRLLVATDEKLSIWEQREDSGIIVWNNVWETGIESAPVIVRLSETGAAIAYAYKDARAVHLIDTRRATLQTLRHPRSITSLTWRRPTAGNRSSLTLFTVTSDSTVRIWQPVLDAPHDLRLWGTIDADSFFEDERAVQVRWLERSVRPEEGGALYEDIFFAVDGRGRISLTTVQNIEQRPPTLLSVNQSQPLPDVHTITPDNTTAVIPIPSPSDTLVMFLSQQSLESLTVTLSSYLDDIKDASDPLPPSITEPFGFQHSETIRGLHLRSDGRAFLTQADSEIILWEATTGTPRNVSKWKISCELAAIVEDDVLVYTGKTLALLTKDGSQRSVQALKTPILRFMNSTMYLLALTDTHCLELDRHSLEILAEVPLPAGPVSIRVPIFGHNREILDVTAEGDLSFWRYADSEWRQIGGLATGIQGVSMAACSVDRRSALVKRDGKGYHLSIWNSRLSQFSSGLEFECTFSEEILSLRWTFGTSDGLAVCFKTHSVIMWPERMTYFDDAPSWASWLHIYVDEFSPLALTGASFLGDGSLVVTAGNQVISFNPKLKDPPLSESSNLLELIINGIGPLPDWHPQVVLQCLLWNKVDRVKQVIERLAKVMLEEGATDASVHSALMHLSDEPYDDEYQENQQTSAMREQRHSTLFETETEGIDDDDPWKFSRPLITKLLKILDIRPIPMLTVKEEEHLEALIETTLEIDEQRRALDANGIRYLISIRSFYILNRKSKESPSAIQDLPPVIEARSRIRYRDMVWAYHSETQGLLLQTCTQACNDKMAWSDARALGVFLWVTSTDVLKNQMEIVARNEYMAGGERDPERCSLYYFALGKRRLVHGLWMQAAWHPEQTVMLQFLSNDFDIPRWKTAALKNAYALLGKKRWQYAAAFFLLGGALQDAVNVCVKQLNDIQLAIAIARIYEQSDNGSVLRDLLLKTIIPIAFEQDNRWLGSWAFWMLHKRDMAVRIVMTPLSDLAKTLDVPIEIFGRPNYDDPSLAMLFAQLKAKTLQAAKGTSEIAPQTEFNFVLQIARVFCRMGCHILALDLVRSWSFDRPTAVVTQSAVDDGFEMRPTAVSSARRSSFFNLAGRRRSSVLIDVDVKSLPQTRAPSPKLPTVAENSAIAVEAIQPRHTGIGSLMKSAKQDMKVPEFDMNAFF